MTELITIYQILTVSASSEKSIRYSLVSPGTRCNPYFAISDDGGKVYRLPQGYTSGRNAWDEPCIWDPGRNRCMLITDHAGQPALLCARGTISLVRQSDGA